MNFNQGANQDFPSYRGAVGFQYPDLRSFRNNQEAHTFVDSVLNSGGGYTGTVASARNLPIPRSEAFQAHYMGSNSLSLVDFGGALNEQTPRRIGAADIIWGTGSPVDLHPTITLQRHLTPAPSSGLLLIANVDTPIEHPGRREQAINRFNNRSPPLSPNSVASSCSSCGTYRQRGCLCHLYCEHHALSECPVHGYQSSSNESGIKCCSSPSGSVSSGCSNYSLPN